MYTAAAASLITRNSGALEGRDGQYEVLLVREAGGTVTSLDGAPHRIATRTLIASNQECWGELQASLEAAGVVGLDPSVEEAEAAEAAGAAAEAEAAADRGAAASPADSWTLS